MVDQSSAMQMIRYYLTTVWTHTESIYTTYTTYVFMIWMDVNLYIQHTHEICLRSGYVSLEADLGGGCRDRQHDEQALAQARMAHHGQQALLLCPGRHAVLQGGLRQAGLVSAGDSSQASYCITLQQECTEQSLLRLRIADGTVATLQKCANMLLLVTMMLSNQPCSNKAATSLLTEKLAIKPATPPWPNSCQTRLQKC